MNEKAERKERIEKLIAKLNQLKEENPDIFLRKYELWKIPVSNILLIWGISAVISLVVIFIRLLTYDALIQLGISPSLIKTVFTICLTIFLSFVLFIFGAALFYDPDGVSFVYRVECKDSEIKYLEEALAETEKEIKERQEKRAECQRVAQKFKSLEPIIVNKLYGKIKIDVDEEEAEVSILGKTDSYDLSDNNEYIRLLRNVIEAKNSSVCKEIHEFEASLSEEKEG